MENILKTMRVKREDGEEVVINASDFDEAIHTEIEGEEPDTSDEDDEDDGEDETGEMDPIEEARRSAILIPEDWEDLPHSGRKAIAIEISGDADANKTKVQINATIEAEIARRSEG